MGGTDIKFNTSSHNNDVSLTFDQEQSLNCTISVIIFFAIWSPPVTKGSRPQITWDRRPHTWRHWVTPLGSREIFFNAMPGRFYHVYRKSNSVLPNSRIPWLSAIILLLLSNPPSQTPVSHADWHTYCETLSKCHTCGYWPVNTFAFIWVMPLCCFCCQNVNLDKAPRST